ncbi:class I SAM-dependent methyltransferase [Streptomyces sp. NRRL F-4489]|uniref:class I SAM-dependent methyltransferase n=1 Tax=Streptomyces sp. NRRL F-4489 TaxID=1609095 RepID=UPI00099F21E8|nr:class I SAM-dependent methyltransferase [Streptomyces sp. NRRL F-4489]
MLNHPTNTSVPPDTFAPPLSDFPSPLTTPNAQQARAWNGYEGEHWAGHQERWDAVNGGFNEPLLDAAAIGRDERVLDIGCGAGATTRLAARRAAGGHALGVDLSAPMLARARAGAAREGLANVAFEQADAQVHAFPPDGFDVAVSRFGVMFFADPVAAFGNIGRALRPGGRLAFVCGAEAGDSEWFRALAALRPYLPMDDFGASGDGYSPGMFSFADPGRVRAVLSAAGFAEVAVAPAVAYGVWGRDAADAAAFLLGSGPGRHLLARASAGDRARARAALTEALRRHEDGGALRMRATAWLVTAVRPAAAAH